MKKALYEVFVILLILGGLTLFRLTSGDHRGQVDQNPQASMDYTITSSTQGPQEKTQKSEVPSHAVQPIEPLQEGQLINPNRASVTELDKLPGVGAVIAQRIVDYRLANGSFQSVDDLLKVKGIGEKKLEKIRKFLTFEPPFTTKSSNASP